MAIEMHCFSLDKWTPKLLGVIFITPSIIFCKTQRVSLICPRTGVEYSILGNWYAYVLYKHALHAWLLFVFTQL